MNEQVQKRIGKRIRQARKKLGLNQEQLADRLGQDRATLASYEIGRHCPHASDLPKLAEVLGVSILFFFQGEHEDSDSASD